MPAGNFNVKARVILHVSGKWKIFKSVGWWWTDNGKTLRHFPTWDVAFAAVELALQFPNNVVAGTRSEDLPQGE